MVFSTSINIRSFYVFFLLFFFSGSGSAPGIILINYYNIILVFNSKSDMSCVICMSVLITRSLIERHRITNTNRTQSILTTPSVKIYGLHGKMA
jgi:hypothetical protein